MTDRWYSPQLSREIVSRLYYKAKTEGIAMTTLVDRIVEQALDRDNELEVWTSDEERKVQDRE